MKSKVSKILIIFIILALVVGGVFGYLYICTDAFKSNKDKFYKYIAQNREIVNVIDDELINEYETKKISTPYENNGKLKLSFDAEGSSKEDFELSTEGKIDNSSKKAQRDYKLSYQNQDVKFRYVQDKDKYAAKLTGDDETDYIGIENNNLKEFAKKLGIDDTDNIPDKISLDELQKEFFTADELKQIYKNYKNIILDSFDDNKFSKVDGDLEGYKLTLTDTDLLQLTVKLLENLKNDNMILEKVAKCDKENLSVEELKNEIDNLLSELKETETENKELLYITVYPEKGKLVKTEIAIPEIDGVSANMTITKSSNSVNFDMSFLENDKKYQILIDINKENKGSNIENNINCKIKTDEDILAEIKINAEYYNIKELSDVIEKGKVEITYNVEEQEGKLTAEYDNENKFVQSVETENLDSVKLINDYSEKELQRTVSGITDSVEELTESFSIE